MEFDENHKVKWWLINKEEARAYIDFLEIERDRHYNEIINAECDRIPLRRKYAIAFNEFLQSAIRRHNEDIEGIDTLIQEVKHWHQI